MIKLSLHGYRARVEGPDSTQVIPRSYHITSVEISDLKPSTQYTFKVSAVTVAGTTPRRARGETSMPCIYYIEGVQVCLYIATMMYIHILNTHSYMYA
jgi:hypothetical protein